MDKEVDCGVDVDSGNDVRVELNYEVGKEHDWDVEISEGIETCDWVFELEPLSKDWKEKNSDSFKQDMSWNAELRSNRILTNIAFGKSCITKKYARWVISGLERKWLPKVFDYLD